MRHNPRCAIFNDPPSLRQDSDCNCGAIPPLPDEREKRKGVQGVVARVIEREKLEAEIERLRKALEEIAAAADLEGRTPGTEAELAYAALIADQGKAPRTWTLNLEGGGSGLVVATNGPRMPRAEPVPVIEAAPVEAEREKLLDVIDRLMGSQGGITTATPCRLCGAIAPAHYCGPQCSAQTEARNILKANNRLGGSE